MALSLQAHFIRMRSYGPVLLAVLILLARSSTGATVNTCALLADLQVQVAEVDSTTPTPNGFKIVAFSPKPEGDPTYVRSIAEFLADEITAKLEDQVPPEKLERFRYFMLEGTLEMIANPIQHGNGDSRGHYDANRRVTITLIEENERVRILIDDESGEFHEPKPNDPLRMTEDMEPEEYGEVVERRRRAGIKVGGGWGFRKVRALGFILKFEELRNPDGSTQGTRVIMEVEPGRISSNLR